jgi:hypothetical protein
MRIEYPISGSGGRRSQANEIRRRSKSSKDICRSHLRLSGVTVGAPPRGVCAMVLSDLAGVCPAKVVRDKSGEFVCREQRLRGELVGVEAASAGEVWIKGK